MFNQVVSRYWRCSAVVGWQLQARIMARKCFQMSLVWEERHVKHIGCDNDIRNKHNREGILL